jgi:hypothetical protein
LPIHRAIKKDAAFLVALRPEEQNLLNMLTVQSMETLENFRKNFTPAFAMADLDFLEQLKKNYCSPLRWTRSLSHSQRWY